MIRIRWPRRRRGQEVSEARSIVEKARRDLADAKERRAREEREITVPLRRQRERMLQRNHVYEDLAQLLRGQGGS